MVVLMDLFFRQWLWLQKRLWILNLKAYSTTSRNVTVTHEENG